ncbi:MAG: aldose epimerase family protein [Candidatus Acidiferrum sp.]
MELWGRAGILVAVIVLGYFSIAWTSSRSSRSSAKQLDKLEISPFGRLSGGAEIVEYTLHNRNGLSARVINYGATLRELWVPDHGGKLADVVLGFENVEGYAGKQPYFGATIGRYANRIAKGHFSLEGKEYQLAINNPPNSLHGGSVGFDHRVWQGAPVDSAQGASVRFTYVSKDGEENFPGTVTATVTYTLTDENELKLEYTAETDKATPLNLTNHSYFNLAGTSDVLAHVLYLNADTYTPVDATLIPTGEIRSVVNSPLDFRKPAAIGARIGELKDIGGYDHNFVVNGKIGTLRLAARVADPVSRRQMEVWTTEPGIQFYSGIHLDGSLAEKGDIAHKKYGALCLETQHFPDSPNHPEFPTTILRPESLFHSETIYKFSAR